MSKNILIVNDDGIHSEGMHEPEDLDLRPDPGSAI